MPFSVPEGYNPETAILQEQMKKIEKEAQAKREKEEEAAKKAEVRCVCVFRVRVKAFVLGLRLSC